MRYADIIKIRQKWLAAIKLHPSINHPTAYTATILAFLNIDLNEAANEVHHDLINALTIALKLDSQNLKWLNNASKEVIKELNTLLSNEEGLFITSLTDASTILKSPFALVDHSKKANVARVFNAIEQLYNSNDEIPNSCVPIDVKEGEETFRFYFHGENYKNAATRKETVVRLYTALVTIWNDALDNKQLAFFLSNIQGGPCVEAATREAMEKVTLSFGQRVIPVDFNTAMQMYFSQAQAFLRFLSLPQTMMNVHDIILKAYGSVQCTPKANTPSVINSENILQLIKALECYDKNYWTDDFEKNDTSKELTAHLNAFSVAERLSILNSLQIYAPPEISATMDSTIHSYKMLCELSKKELTPHQLNVYLGYLRATGTFNTVIIEPYTPLMLAAKNNQINLIKALLEIKEIDINEGNANGESFLSIIAKPSSRNLLKTILKELPHLKKQITAASLSRPILTGPDAGISPLFWLAGTSEGLALLESLLEQNPHLAKQITLEALCHSVLQGPNAGISPLFRLMGNVKGQAILKTLLDQNSDLAKEMTIEALCQPVMHGLEAGKSPLYWLSWNLVLLKSLLEKNPTLVKNMTMEALCRPSMQGNNAGTSPLYVLTGTPDGRALLKSLFEQNPDLVKNLTLEALCRPKMQGDNVGASPLFWLTNNDDGRALLKSLLELNPNLAKQMTLEALCRPVTQDPFTDMSPFYGLTAKADGQAILKSLLEQNPNLFKNMTMETLSRPKMQGDDPGASPLYWLTTTVNGQFFLKYLLEQNSDLAKEMTIEVLCQPIMHGLEAGKSPLYWLTGNPALLQSLLEKNPTLVQDMTTEALCRPSMQGDNAGAAPLFWLTNAKGAHVLLKSLLEQNPNLAKQMTLEALCRPVTQGPFTGMSPFYGLTGRGDGPAIFKSLSKQNPNLVKQMTLEALCRPIMLGPEMGCSPLYWLTVNIDSRLLLKSLLEQNPNLAKQMTLQALCHPIMQGSAKGKFPLYFLTTPEGLEIFALLLKNNDTLGKQLTAEILCKDHQGNDSENSIIRRLAKSDEGTNIIKLVLEINPQLFNSLKIYFPDNIIPTSAKQAETINSKKHKLDNLDLTQAKQQKIGLSTVGSKIFPSSESAGNPSPSFFSHTEKQKNSENNAKGNNTYEDMPKLTTNEDDDNGSKFQITYYF